MEAHESELVTGRRAIEVLAYLWIAVVTALLAVVVVLGTAQDSDHVDGLVGSGAAIFLIGLPWLIAILAMAGCLSELRESPRSHGPVWWMVVVVVAYGAWLMVLPGVFRIIGGATLVIAVAVFVLAVRGS